MKSLLLFLVVLIGVTIARDEDQMRKRWDRLRRMKIKWSFDENNDWDRNDDQMREGWDRNDNQMRDDSGQDRRYQSRFDERYEVRMDKAFKSVGECLIFNSMVNNNLSIGALVSSCIDGSPIQSVLPLIYSQSMNKPTECLETVSEEFRSRPNWGRIQNLLRLFATRKASQKHFCRFLDTLLVPFTCVVRNRCPSEKDRQFTHALLATYYSVQQFLNNGMSTTFTCKYTNLHVNPELYKFGLKYDPDIEYLLEDVNCKRYEHSTPTTTTELPHTTPEPAESSIETIIWSWDINEDDAPSKTKQESNSVRIHLDRHAPAV